MQNSIATLCWNCKHAVPKINRETGGYITGCDWSIRRKPILGWETCCHRTYAARTVYLKHTLLHFARSSKRDKI